jgi:glycolate oxidase iron-sulfur subunit
MGINGFTAPDLPSRDIYDQCVRCGLCLPSCPTYLETMVETSSPRGRIALIKAVAEHQLDLTSPGFVHQMSECLDCRACEAVCPSGVEYGQLIETGRTQVQRAVADRAPRHIRLLRQITIGGLFGDYRLIRLAAFLLRAYQRGGLQSFARKSGLLKRLGLAEVEALAPRISETFFVPRDQHWASHAERRTTVFMHVGCIMHVAFSEVNVATVRMLQRVGCDVIAPAKQGCCGAIAVHAGELERGRELAKRNIVAFEASKADFYIINAAGCGSTLKEYGRLFAEVPEWADRAARFSEAVRDINEFLDAMGLPPGMGWKESIVTYQEPCHLAHAQRITLAPRRLLAQIPGLTLREMPESSLCCGSAGIYNLTQPEMARRLQRRKIENALRVEPEVIVTANPGCALQLVSGLREAGRSVSVKHVVELLDDAYLRAEPVSGSRSLMRSAPTSAASKVG